MRYSKPSQICCSIEMEAGRPVAEAHETGQSKSAVIQTLLSLMGLSFSESPLIL